MRQLNFFLLHPVSVFYTKLVFFTDLDICYRLYARILIGSLCYTLSHLINVTHANTTHARNLIGFQAKEFHLVAHDYLSHSDEPTQLDSQPITKN